MATADIIGYALVQNDTSLKVDRHTIRLHGIYILPTETTCCPYLRKSHETEVLVYGDSSEKIAESASKDSG
jgi:hypothetical protein